MSDFLKNNLIYLRLMKHETQAETASALGLSRSTYANWENGDNRPKSDKFEKIIGHFRVSEKEMLYSDLTGGNLVFTDKGPELSQNRKSYKLKEPGLEEDWAVHEASDTGEYFATRDSGGESMAYVSVQARAAYVSGYGDPACIGKLPVYRLPGYYNGSYRIFEVDGLSMFDTLHDKDRVITRRQQLAEIRDDNVYVLLTQNHGLLIKRLINQYPDNKIICKSDNHHSGEYPAILLDPHEIKEVWQVVERLTKQLSGPGEIYSRINHLEAELNLLKKRLDKGV